MPNIVAEKLNMVKFLGLSKKIKYTFIIIRKTYRVEKIKEVQRMR